MQRVLGRVHGITGVGIEQQEIAINQVVAQSEGQDDGQHDEAGSHQGSQGAEVQPPGVKQGVDEPGKQHHDPGQNRLPQEGGGAQAEAEGDGQPPTAAGGRPGAGGEVLAEGQGALQGPEQGANEEGFGLHHGTVEDEVGVDGHEQGGQVVEGEGEAAKLQRRRVGEEAAGEAVEQERQEDAGQDSPGQARAQRVEADGGVDGGDESGVKERPVGGGGVGRGERIPGLAEAVAVPGGQAGGEHGVGGFVFGRRGAVAQVKGHAQAQQHGKGQDGQEDQALVFTGHGW